MSRRIAFEVEVEVEDLEGQESAAPTETTLQDWMEAAPMAWSAEGINAVFIGVTLTYDEDDFEEEDEQ